MFYSAPNSNRGFRVIQTSGNPYSPTETTRFYVNPLGNVGIGTDAPFSKLTIGSAASGNGDIDEIAFRSINNSANDRIGYKQRIGFYGKDEYGNENHIYGSLEMLYAGNDHYPTYQGHSSSSMIFNTTTRNASSPTEKMRIHENGNVGINNSAPAYNLDVTGNINFTGSLTQNGVAFESGGGSFDSNTNGTFILNENVGIGTDNPSNLLHLYGTPKNTTIQTWTYAEDANNNNYRNLELITPNGQNDPWTFSTNNCIDFKIDNQSALSIDDNGYVGIGTNTPNADLQVKGRVTIGTAFGGPVQDQAALSVSPIDGANGKTISAGHNNSGAWGNIGYSVLGGFVNGYAGFAVQGKSNATNYSLLVNAEGQTRLNSATGQNLSFNIGNAEKMRLTPDGYLGIGTNTPAHALEVNGNVCIKGENLLIGNDFNDSLRFNHHKNSAGTQSFSYIDYNDNGNLFFRATSNGSYPTTMTLRGNGNVGVGTAAPSAKLHIQESDNSFKFSGTNMIFQNSSNILRNQVSQAAAITQI